jgi:archaellum biogenesis ATPase FlaH
MGDILDAALEYAEAGYAVIPVKRSDKAPYTPNGLEDASKDATMIRQWWQHWPEANVAIVCGHISGDLFVIDIDIKPDKGKYGDEELLKWQGAYGDFPETVRQRTGSGGQHQFFTHPDIALYKNKVNAIPGIDIRGEGSYVVVAPSVYEDGRVYEWEGASILDKIEVAKANESVIRLLALNPRDQKGETSLQSHETISMKDVPEGQRNSTIYSAACALRHYDFSFNAAIAAILQTVSEWKTPVPEHEIRKTVESAYTHAPGEVSIYSVNGITAEYDENGKYIPKLPPVIPVASIINPPPLKSPIIAGYLREGEAMLLSGSPKAGKSFLICQLALAVASGTDWVGQKCKKKKVLYIDAELQREVAQNRMHDIWRKCDTVIPVYPDNLDLVSTKSDSVTLSDIADDIEHNAGKYDLVIIDPLYMFINSDQNDNTQMKKEMDQIKRIYATGASVIVNHHMTKGMQNGKMSIDRASGAGVISRFFDSILTLNLLQPEQEDDGRPERIEADTRSFKQPDPINLWFNGYHTLDRNGVLDGRPLLDPKKESNDKKVDDIVKRVNHCYLAMKEAGELTNGRFTVDEFMDAYVRSYGKLLARTTAREHLEKAGYSKESGERTATRNGKPFKTKVTFYYPDGLEVSKSDD